MATDAPDDTSPDYRTAYGALAACAFAVAVVAFAVSYHGIFDLLLRVARLPWFLAVLGPFGVDFLAGVGIAASFVMRHEPLHRRAYAWLVTAVGLSMSVAGNAVDGVARSLQHAGVIALALTPVVVFLSSHLVVVARRAMEEHRRRTQATTPPADDAGEDQDDTAECDPPPTRPFDPQRYARQRRRRGDSANVIAAQLADRGHTVSARTVLRWTEGIQPAQQGKRTATPDPEPAATDPEPPAEETAA